MQLCKALSEPSFYRPTARNGICGDWPQLQGQLEDENRGLDLENAGLKHIPVHNQVRVLRPPPRLSLLTKMTADELSISHWKHSGILLYVHAKLDLQCSEQTYHRPNQPHNRLLFSHVSAGSPEHVGLQLVDTPCNASGVLTNSKYSVVLLAMTCDPTIHLMISHNPPTHLTIYRGVARSKNLE